MSWAAKRTTTLKEDKIYCTPRDLWSIYTTYLWRRRGYAEVRLREEIQRRQEGRGIKSAQDLAGMLRQMQNAHAADDMQSRRLYLSHEMNSSPGGKTSFSLSMSFLNPTCTDV